MDLASGFGGAAGFAGADRAGAGLRTGAFAGFAGAAASSSGSANSSNTARAIFMGTSKDNVITGALSGATRRQNAKPFDAFMTCGASPAARLFYEDISRPPGPYSWASGLPFVCHGA